MLIIGLIAAAFLYGLLFWIYLMAESRLDSSLTFLTFIDKMLSINEPSVFFLFRWLLLLTLFYVVADAILSPAKRGLRNRKQRRIDEKNGKAAFKSVKPIAPPPPPSDDDLAAHY